MKVFLVILIAILIFVFTYLASRQDKFKKAVLFSALAAALSFAGQYIVDWISELEKEDEVIMAENDISTENKTVPKKDDIYVKDNKEISTEEAKNVADEGIQEGNEDIEYITFIGETHEPSDIATKVSVTGWEEDKDYDIAGKTYDGGVKITIYNMFSALDGNSSNMLNEIISEIHYALNEQEIYNLAEEDQYFSGKFVVGKETDASPSTAIISILTDGEEVYNSGEINCYSLNILPFQIPLYGKKEMVIKTVCQHKGNPLIIGIVNNE